jgi:hypothetical protein
MARLIYARPPGGRKEHLTSDRTTTLCGIDCKPMAKYDKQYGDSKVRPLCPSCRGRISEGSSSEFGKA